MAMVRRIPTYPIVLLPDEIKQHLTDMHPKPVIKYKKANQDRYQYQPPSSVRFDCLLFGKLLYWEAIIAGIIFTSLGVIFLAMVIRQQQIDGILWGSSFLIALIAHFTVREFLKELDKANRADLQRSQQLYWRDNQRINLDFNQQLKAQIRTNYFANLQRKSPYQKSRLAAKKSSLSLQVERGQVASEDTPKGVSETFLLNFLRLYFADCQITEDYFPLENSNFGYTTDFTIVEPTMGVAIDLEVDEPYEGKCKTPHHCYDQRKDLWRNKFFTERGWIVVRVSEFQVVHQPESVCRLVAQILARVTGNSKYLQPLEAYADLEIDKCWNTIACKQMINQLTREKYLDRAGIYKYDQLREKANRIAAQKQERSRLKARKKAGRKYRYRKN